MKIVNTNDNCQTLFSERFGETYHSVSAGAFTESIKKFCEPCNVFERAKSKNIKLLDICFGLGYNTVAFIDTVMKSNRKCKMSILGIERDLDVIKASLLLNWGGFNRWKWVIKKLLENRGFNHGFQTLSLKRKELKILIYIGEARKVLSSTEKQYKNWGDVAFHDPFSPKVNCELWTEDFFKIINHMLKDKARFATYSAATPVRIGLIRAGFGVLEGPSIGRKGRSTVAIKGKRTDKEFLKRLLRSNYAVPFRDPGLNGNPKDIKDRRDKCLSVLNVFV